MTEEQKVAETGQGSPAGLRWFISCRYPHLNITIRPAEDKTPTTRAIKGIYASFQALAKPDSLQGLGKRERNRDDGTDMNDSGKWGIFGPIVDPGPVPEDGYKDGIVSCAVEEDGKTVKKDIKLKAAKKQENRDIIDHLRSIGLYRRTRQINEVDLNSLLAEVNWDPIPFSGHVVGAVNRGRPSIGKDGVTDSAVSAPEESRAAAPAVKVPSLSRTKVTA
jgi:hypothetical protein